MALSIRDIKALRPTWRGLARWTPIDANLSTYQSHVVAMTFPPLKDQVYGAVSVVNRIRALLIWMNFTVEYRWGWVSVLAAR